MNSTFLNANWSNFLKIPEVRPKTEEFSLGKRELMAMLLGRQLPDDNRNMMISRSSGRSGFIYMVNV